MRFDLLTAVKCAIYSGYHLANVYEESTTSMFRLEKENG